MTLKNGFRKCLFFVLSANGWKRTKHGLFVFPPKKTLIWRRHCSIDQSCCSMTSKRFLESSSGMKFFQPSVRLTNQKPDEFVSVRQTNQIALFSFVCCFCFVPAFSFQGHAKIALSPVIEYYTTIPQKGGWIVMKTLQTSRIEVYLSSAMHHPWRQQFDLCNFSINMKKT